MEPEESNHPIGASFLGIISALALHFRHRQSKRSKDEHLHNFLAPLLERSDSGRAGRVERFSIYVVRQMGFKEGEECHQLRELAQEYLKRSKGCKERIFEYFGDDPNAIRLGEKLVEELDILIYSYFAFHWSKVPEMICQVLSVDVDQKKFKDAVMAATRKLRFEKITKDLKVTRMFSTLVEEMNIIGPVSNSDDSSKHTDVMVPVAHSERSPVLLLMGGGMGAGKSTVLKEILKDSFWSGAAKNAVVVEADAFKETDVIYRALSSRGHHQDMLQIAELVHQSSTDAASSLLVTALNEGRDVIMDGTLSWKPFVEQTIAMARDVHQHRYRMGEGYKIAEDGTVIERYWEQVEEEGESPKVKRPYRVELVGVVCDAYLAVVRGIRRAIATGRAVRVKSQLKSHKRFATAFKSYSELVDNAKLYSTNDVDGPAKLIAWKDGDNKLLVDQDEIRWLDLVKSLNDEAESIYEVYSNPDAISKPGSIWFDKIMSPTRSGVQDELRNIIRQIENPVQNVNPSI
ncbi:uncharacterized protein LOC116002117 [Ipomoea triloba]|uniref:uncharacterized protein LOC116002117 n=1 Tax=Ipomoea triloba TaxID=35885 RepID=UPI00125DE2BF|nr:uncharacterized protein LOC116002117 [Ipomoea triloba]